MPQMSPEEVAKYKKRIINPDGSISTERSMTIEFTTNEGKPLFINIPTIWNGKQLTREKAIKKARKEGLENFPQYNKLKEAISAAKKRSKEIGKAIKKLA